MGTPYKIVKDAAAWWPVKWNEASDDVPGEVVEREIRVMFKRLDLEQAKAAEKIDTGNVDFVMTVARDWSGIEDDKGKAVPFNEAWVSKAMLIPNVAEAFGIAWKRFILAIPETRQGNSKPSPAGGPEQATAAETAKPE